MSFAAKEKAKMDNVVSEITMKEKKLIELFAHDTMTKELLEWAPFNKDSLSPHGLYAQDADKGMGNGRKLL